MDRIELLAGPELKYPLLRDFSEAEWMSGAPGTDEDLVRRTAAGEPDAFADLFDRHSPRVLGLLVKLLGSRGEAEEVLQEVFLQVWSRAADYDPRRAGVGGWLLLLARSRALDRIRSRRSRVHRERTAHEDAVLDRGMRENPVGTRRLEAEERSSQVFSALGELPEEQRRAVELAFFEGLSHSQIARRMEAPLGTVKSRILLGMKKLRQTLSARGMTAPTRMSR
jgi:RNA polymerase sigma-70 factor (ECF subfamily)